MPRIYKHVIGELNYGNVYTTGITVALHRAGSTLREYVISIPNEFRGEYITFSGGIRRNIKRALAANRRCSRKLAEMRPDVESCYVAKNAVQTSEKLLELYDASLGDQLRALAKSSALIRMHIDAVEDLFREVLRNEKYEDHPAIKHSIRSVHRYISDDLHAGNFAAGQLYSFARHTRTDFEREKKQQAKMS